MFLLKEPETTTYKCEDTETKKSDSITLQNFQKLFIKNDMTWVDKKEEFIYTIKKLTEKDTIQQLLSKTFNENACLKKLNRENTFWLTYNNGRAYRSINRIYRYFNTPDKGTYLEDKSAHFLVLIRMKGFEKQTNAERKYVYTLSNHFTYLRLEEKNMLHWVLTD